MKIKNWTPFLNSEADDLGVLEVKEHTNGLTGKRDPMFIFQSKDNKSFVCASSIARETAILDDGTEVSVREHFLQ